VTFCLPFRGKAACRNVGEASEVGSLEIVAKAALTRSALGDTFPPPSGEG